MSFIIESSQEFTVVVAFIISIVGLLKGLSRSEAYQVAHAEFELRLWDLLASDHSQSFTARALAEQLGVPEKKIRRILVGWAERQLVQHDSSGFHNDHPQYDTFRALAD